MSDPKRPYWDSVVFLDLAMSYCPDDDPQYLVRLRALWRLSEQGNFDIVTSALTIAEVLWMRGKLPPNEAQARTITDFFQSSNLTIVEVTRAIGEQARDLVWREGVRPKDAIHVACALTAKCDVFYTRDDALQKKGEALGGMRVESPSAYMFHEQGELLS